MLLITTDFVGALHLLEFIQLLKQECLKSLKILLIYVFIFLNNDSLHDIIQKIWESLFHHWGILTVFFNSSSIFFPLCERSKLALPNYVETSIFLGLEYFLKCSIVIFFQKRVLNCRTFLEKSNKKDHYYSNEILLFLLRYIQKLISLAVLRFSQASASTL